MYAELVRFVAMEMINLSLFGHTFAECFTLSENFRMPREMRDDACLAYVQEGTQEIYAPTQKLIAKDKESILMKCGNYIANFSNVTPKTQFKSVVFHLDPQAIKKSFGSRDLSFLSDKRKSGNTDPALKLSRNVLLDSFVSSMTPYFDEPTLANDELMAVKLQELVMILSDSGKNALATEILGTLYDPEYAAFQSIINANLYNNMSISELAHLTNKSESTFKREFKKHYNESPAKYFRDKRIKRAAELLNTTSSSISEIAWECGFENIAHFSTSFNETFGKSPRNYRNDLN